MVTLSNTLRAAVALMVLLVMASLLAHISSASSPAVVLTTPARGYYVTIGTAGFDGAHALKACTAGYHLASMYEIADTTNLTYRKALGYNQDDSGNGPPWGAFGWVRTGNNATTGGTISSEGHVNCNNWTSNASTDYGTAMVILEPSYGLSAPHYNMGPWTVVAVSCDQAYFAWCVQN